MLTTTRLTLLTATAALMAPPAAAELIKPIYDLLTNIGNQPPPSFLWTPNPSPQCADVNQGEYVCCQGSLAGDLPLVVFLADLYGYKLNPNDVNGVLCGEFPVDQCPGVTMCCQVTALDA